MARPDNAGTPKGLESIEPDTGTITLMGFNCPSCEEKTVFKYLGQHLADEKIHFEGLALYKCGVSKIKETFIGFQKHLYAIAK